MSTQIDQPDELALQTLFCEREVVTIGLWPHSSEGGNQAAEQRQKIETIVSSYVVVWLVAALFLFFGWFHFNYFILKVLSLLALLLIPLFARIGGMTHLVLDENGIELQWRSAGAISRKKTIGWQEVTGVELDKNPHEPVRNWELRLSTRFGTTFKLKLSKIATSSSWRRLVAAFEKWGPVCGDLEADIMDRLDSTAVDPGFTTLWLEALSEPPGRERLGPLAPGALLGSGRYAILRQLAAGGQGIAYLASAAAEEVVVKEYMLPVYVDIKARRQAIRQFEHEARLLADLDHPQIVRLLDYFAQEHRAYLVLEYIRGSTLKERIETDGPLSAAVAVDYMCQICDILSYLHSREPPVIHRDLTPDNLMVDAKGRLKLIDFMVATTGDSPDAPVAGKRAYMSPEQFSGRSSAQSDIYSLGATAYFMLTGLEPEPLACLYPVPSRPDLPHELDAIVARCTELDTTRRYRDSRAVLSDLHLVSRDYGFGRGSSSPTMPDSEGGG